MLRVFSQRFHANLFIELLAFLFLTGVAGYSQSLGNVAHENREKKAAETSATPPKVITNADLPKNPDEYTGTAEDNKPATPSPADAAASRKAAEQRAAEQHAAEHWKKQILAQKNTIASQQAQIDKLRASIHFVDLNTYYDYYAGLAYNGRQARRMERLKQMEQQLDQQKQKLEEMQEAARHAGMHTAVYDP